MTPAEFRARLRGVYNIVLTPFRDDFTLDVAALERNINAVLAGGVQGLLVGGTYGEFPSMSTSERKTLIHEAVRIAAARVPVLACTASSSTLECLELTQHAQDTGADGAMLTAPFVTEVADADIIRHFTYIAERTDIGLVLYNNPSIGLVMLPSLLDRLADLPHVVGLKQGATSLPEITATMELIGDRVAVMCGSDTAMLAGLAIGMPGVTSTNSSFIVAIIMETYRAMASGDDDRARASHQRWAPFRVFARRAGQPAAAKAAMDLVGLRGGACRPPLAALGPDARSILRGVLEPMGVSGQAYVRRT